MMLRAHKPMDKNLFVISKWKWKELPSSIGFGTIKPSFLMKIKVPD